MHESRRVFVCVYACESESKWLLVCVCVCASWKARVCVYVFLYVNKNQVSRRCESNDQKAIVDNDEQTATATA